MLTSVVYLGSVTFFVMCMGLGTFLHYQKYAWWAYLVVYVSLLGLPFLFVQATSAHPRECIVKAITLGFGAAAVLGYLHLFIWMDGDKEAFVVLLPLLALMEGVCAASIWHKAT